MRKVAHLTLASIAAALLLVGCAAPGDAPHNADNPEAMLVTRAEAAAHGGWSVSRDDGPVDGDSKDCTGAPYKWPRQKTLAHASQLLDGASDESIAIIVKRLDSSAAINLKALRGAIAPCVPATGVKLHGAMIHALGDDSFAYQSRGQDDNGTYVLDDTLVACGKYEMEAIWISYSQTFDQAGLESLLLPAVKRMIKAGHCS